MLAELSSWSLVGIAASVSWPVVMAPVVLKLPCGTRAYINDVLSAQFFLKEFVMASLISKAGGPSGKMASHAGVAHDDIPGNNDVSPAMHDDGSGIAGVAHDDAMSFISACSQRPCQSFDISTPVASDEHTSELAAIPGTEQVACDLPGCVLSE